MQYHCTTYTFTRGRGSGQDGAVMGPNSGATLAFTDDLTGILGKRAVSAVLRSQARLR
jgi:hypothetical protein